MAVAGTTAMAQTQETKQLQAKEKTLYVIDGKVASKDVFEKLSSEEIKNISVLKGIEAAIVVSTKEGNHAQKGAEAVEVKSLKVFDSDGEAMAYWKIDDPEADTAKIKSVITVSKNEDGKIVSEEKKSDGSIVVMVRGEKKNDLTKVTPLIIVKNAKGEISTAKSMEEIKPENIKAISVLKDSKAGEFSKYGDITYGVVVIELM